MSIPKFIHGKYDGLPSTLARRVAFLRDARGVHISELSRRARVSQDLLEQIEAGVETWMAVAIRQRVARVLKVDPHILEEVETRIDEEFKLADPPEKVLSDIKDRILDGEKLIECPACGKPMKVWIQEGFDLVNNTIVTPKGHCMTCIFQIKSD